MLGHSEPQDTAKTGFFQWLWNSLCAACSRIWDYFFPKKLSQEIIFRLDTNAMKQRDAISTAEQNFKKLEQKIKNREQNLDDCERALSARVGRPLVPAITYSQDSEIPQANTFSNSVNAS